jgi:nitrogen fixation protein NifB
MHLPICPACNIECGFCRRSIGSRDVRPGVSAFILPVKDVLSYVEAARSRCEGLSVIGVAGPGDSLVGDNLFKAFRAVGEAYPEFFKCLSTNGLLLGQRADELIELGVDTLTVTVNAVDPMSLAQIVIAIHDHGRRIEGEKGAAILIRNQLAGIRKMAAAGVTIKVNTVLIPSINGMHIEEIARVVSDAGASMYNIIPLIPQHRFAGYAEPTCGEIEEARGKASKHIDVFRHCQHCRADAIGIPGITDHTADVLGNFTEYTEDVFSHG